jgi:hypothetical protein
VRDVYGVVHIERPRHHLALCNESSLTTSWDVMYPWRDAFPTCLECVALAPEYYSL